MLTCPPTRINLTAADCSDFERRFLARRANLHHRLRGAGVHVGRSPGRPVRLGFVPANANKGRERAQSCSSQATICTEADDEAEDVAITAQAVSLQALRPQQSTLALHGDRSRRPVQPSASPSAKQSSSREPLSPIRPERIQHDARDIQPAGSRSPSKSPSARPGFLLYADPPHVQSQIERQHRIEWARRHGWEPEIPSLLETIVPTIVTQPPASSPLRDVQTTDSLPNPALDPGAPVFVPRTRFGSNWSNAADQNNAVVRSARQASSIESAQSETHLRLRSSFERNSQHSPPGQDQGFETEVIHTTAQQRSRRRANDQNAALRGPVPNLDRYPAIHPQTASVSSRSHRQVVLPRRQSSRQHLVEFERTRRPSRETIQHRATSSAQYSNLTVPPGSLRPISPAASTSSQSTPNLLYAPAGPRFPVRSSSLRGNRAARPGYVDAGNRGNSRATQRSSESSAVFSGDWLSRGSPLDELVKHLNHLAGRPRSVGRSFERPPVNHGRVSLLNGDPFRLNESPELEPEKGDEDETGYATFEATVPLRRRADIVVAARSSPPNEDCQSRSSTEEDPVALALGLPSPELPSSPVSQNTSSTQQATPTARALRPPTSKAPTPSHVSSVAGSTPTAMTLFTAVTATPRVPVYNDSLPPNSQPQTPGDIARRPRGRFDLSVSTRRHHTGEANTTPTQGRTPYRHTYPSAVLPQESPEHYGIPDRMSLAVEQLVTETQQATRVQQQQQQQRGSGSSENDIEPAIGELEENRRTWVQRQESGSLDVTPPREGRFERYLS
ncbi:Hypothetical predicted protein [Lecanosticta acicola]|uniref:Uncharacterized protein n=1 Tax=Lecanosticta acicola TaxID=111012 RepID=A0AAI9E9H7_9PEZI|nr:Hypothetical predicted protein [Lecanosticta acicola]